MGFESFPDEENERIFRRVAATGEPFCVEEKPFEFCEVLLTWSHDVEVAHDGREGVGQGPAPRHSFSR